MADDNAPELRASRNSDKLRDFTRYCCNHPHERFWQALRNWAGVNQVIIVRGAHIDCQEGQLHDTFYDE